MKAMINFACHANSKKTLLIAGLAFALTACGGGGGNGGGPGCVPPGDGRDTETPALNIANGIDAGTLTEADAINRLGCF